MAPSSESDSGGERDQKSRWSWTIGRPFGIEVSVHATFVLLLVWVAWSHLAVGGVPMAVHGLVVVAAVFSVIVMHELGHALMARRFGIRTLGITLLPIGGVSRLERMPEKPAEELLVALAGPAVNVVLAIVFGAVLAMTEGPVDVGALTGPGGSLVAKLFAINVSLAVFNLLPAFPMDGGRVVRALLASRMDYARATALAARIGQGMALLFGIVGLFWNPLLLLIALFVWMGAQQEAAAVQLRFALAGTPASSAMITDLKTLASEDPLSRAAALIVAGSQQIFPVVAAGVPVGIVGVADVVKGLSEGGGDVRVDAVMQRRFETAGPGDPLEDVVRRMQETRAGVILVVEAGRVAGMITPENLGELVMLRTALSGRPG